MSRRLALAAGSCLVWALTVAAGMAWMMDFASAPGRAGTPPGRWPSAVGLARGRDYTLVMAAHPRCPCTRASLEELAIVMADGNGRIAAHVLFFAPDDAASGWWDTDLWRKAADMPAVTPVVDRGGSLQRVFGAETSGSVAVYDAAGRLQFKGGITAARGHTGINVGRLSLLALLESGARARATADDVTPVFGCPLRTPRTADDLQTGGR